MITLWHTGEYANGVKYVPLIGVRLINMIQWSTHMRSLSVTGVVDGANRECLVTNMPLPCNTSCDAPCNTPCNTSYPVPCNARCPARSVCWTEWGVTLIEQRNWGKWHIVILMKKSLVQLANIIITIIINVTILIMIIIAEESHADHTVGENSEAMMMKQCWWRCYCDEKIGDDH